MNYRHAFHAGNFADVHKHVALLMLLEHLHKKPAPFFFLDTHAGRGTYDLRSSEAQRGNEWESGIGRLITASPTASILNKYLALIDSSAQSYPGSPLIAASMLRENDRAVFVERHPEEANALRSTMGKRRRVSVLEGDGYALMKAELPPKENRGLVLIDPPYEQETEFSDAARALQMGLERWPNGIYCIWNPIKAGAEALRTQRMLIQAGVKKMLFATLNVRPADSPLGLNGSGLLIVNPPWQFDVQLATLLPELHRILSADGTGGVDVKWLVGE